MKIIIQGNGRQIFVDEMALLEFFKQLLPSIIVEHNFYETEQEKMKPQALANFIF